MVHGGCASIGCYAMTDPVVDEIWRLVTAALKGGQQRFHVHVFPFRMTEANLSLRSRMPWMPFWRDLKRGYDVFEETQLPPNFGLPGPLCHLPCASQCDGSSAIDSQCVPAAAVRS